MTPDFLDIAERSASCFFACRLPGTEDIIYGDSDSLSSYGSPGFVIMPFSPGESPTVIPFGCNSTRNEIPVWPEVDSISTGKARHKDNVEKAREIIRHSAEINKLVVSRIESHKRHFSLSKVFNALLSRYPDAFVFCFATPVHGIWMGASPELLVSYKSGIASTVALAGTRPINTQEEWSHKNIIEQQIVSDYILDVFRSLRLSPEIRGPEIRKAGPVEHLCSHIYAYASSEEAAEIPFALSPTPALAGFPKEASIDALSLIENHQRACYGGFIGLYKSEADFEYYVNLRSANIDKTKFSIFVGGGITDESVPEDEWSETVRKADTLLDIIPT